MKTRIKNFFAPRLCTGNTRTHIHEGAKPQPWFIEYYVPDDNGKPKRIKFYSNLNTIESKEQRYARAHLLMDEIARKGGRESSDSVLLNELAAMQLALDKKTYGGYQHAVVMLHTYLGTKADKYVTRETAYNFLLWLRKQGKGDTTINNYKLRLSAVYSGLERRNINYVNPFKGITAIKRKPKSLQYFTPEQIHRIKAHISESEPQLWLAIQIMFYCFIRPKEMRMLRIGDIHTHFGYIEIRDEISKNDKCEKVVIPEQLMPDMLKLTNGTHGVNSYIFSHGGMPGKRMLGVNTMYVRFKKVLKELQISGRYSYYSFKHTGAVMAVQAGINVKDLQLQLRHSSLEITDMYLKNMVVTDSKDLKHKFPTL